MTSVRQEVIEELCPFNITDEDALKIEGRAIMRPSMAKMALFGAKNAFFWPKINVLETSSNLFDTIMTGHKKYNLFVLTWLHGGPWGGRRGKKKAFLTPPKDHFGQSGL